MANELRVRAGFFEGLIDNNPLLIGATSLNSSGIAGIPVIGSTQHFPIILDPDGIAGSPEIAYVTVHTSGSTSPTIARGREGTSAREHAQDIPWMHGPTIKDFDGSGGGSGLIGLLAYAPVTDTNILNAGGATSLTAVDATNLIIPFTAPPSGKVLFKFSCLGNVNIAGTSGYWGLLDAANSQVGKQVYMTAISSTTSSRYVGHILATGLTPGAALVYKWAYRVSGNVMNLYGGPNFGDAILEAWAVNV